MTERPPFAVGVDRTDPFTPFGEGSEGRATGEAYGYVKDEKGDIVLRVIARWTREAKP